MTSSVSYFDLRHRMALTQLSSMKARAAFSGGPSCAKSAVLCTISAQAIRSAIMAASARHPSMHFGFSHHSTILQVPIVLTLHQEQTAMEPTIATIKSFIRENEGNLLISSEKDGFTPVIKTDDHLFNTLGIKGAWFVGRGHDQITLIGDDSFHGYFVFNNCGSFSLGVKS